MRDAFGGVFMIRLFLIFIVIYVAFTAVSLNYAKAFRVKNKVISYIEENEIINLNDLNCEGSLAPFISKNQYHKSCIQGNGPIMSKDNSITGYCCNGVIINLKETTDNSYIYTVNTYADWNVGALNMILSLGGQQQNSQEYVGGTWQITGEANVKKRKTN